MTRRPLSEAPFRAFVGKRRLAGRTRMGSTADVVKGYEKLTRESMAEVMQNMESLVNLLQGATPDIMLDIMMPVFEKSQEYCPVDTGLLKSTGDLHVSGDEETRVKVEISYGGNGTAWYAPIVHERVDIGHRPPTRSKFLQAAVEEETENLRARVVEAYAAILGL